MIDTYGQLTAVQPGHEPANVTAAQYEKTLAESARLRAENDHLNALLAERDFTILDSIANRAEIAALNQIVQELTAERDTLKAALRKIGPELDKARYGDMDAIYRLLGDADLRPYLWPDEDSQ